MRICDRCRRIGIRAEIIQISMGLPDGLRCEDTKAKYPKLQRGAAELCEECFKDIVGMITTQLEALPGGVEPLVT